MKNASIFYNVLVLLFIGVIFFIGLWFYMNFERVSKEVEVGFQGKARENPLLAAERLLDRMGTPVKTLQSLHHLENLDTQDTLVLLHYGSFLNDDHIQQLNQWIDEGGHLIIVSETLHDAFGETSDSDPLLTELNIYQFQHDLDETEIEKAPPTDLVWAQYPLKVAFNPNYYLESSYSDQALEIHDEYGTHLLFYYYGIGMITVLSDLAFIENAQIGEYDHAKFLWLLVNFERPATQVWLLSNKAVVTEKGNASKGNMPALPILLWRNLWTVIISATVLLLFWLWLASRRFGPLLPLPSRTRRRLLEHVEASGHFLWKQKQGPVLLHSTKQALLKRLHSVHPDWMHLSHGELSQHLAPLCSLAADDIEQALQTTQSETEFHLKVFAPQKLLDERDFTQTIQILTQIRKSL
ncbi:MAG: hypothetical protein DRR16_14805 [Candidatus Parabeggiatoa sp. nov. 3]|nr:MAG: hypothetical protein DRR00_20200 [Gammaproteobacteria bacterium]RKZ63376.1 MAG: hypothetical protein DRQ99_17240 [Gammaproteobacteria bacterium]RKZ84399.1 MAG: hypothetical protein DRR16_14805 [Gammaproteobacteria bacterium]